MKPTKIAITQRIRRVRNSRKWSSNGIAAAGLELKGALERLGSLLAKSVDRAYFCGSEAIGGGGTTSGGVRGVRAGGMYGSSIALASSRTTVLLARRNSRSTLPA